MDRSTILKSTGCDLKRLPLGALEAFMLSQLDGELTLEEIAAICSLELADASRIATRLLELGAACESEATRAPRSMPGKRPARAAVEEDARRVADPRSERVADPRSERVADPRSERVADPRSERVADPRSEGEARNVDPRVDDVYLRPAGPAARHGAIKEPRARRGEAAVHDSEKKRRRSSRSLSMRAAVPRGSTARAPSADADEPCELDDAIRQEIVDLDAKLPRLDHYAVLGVDRGSEKKAIKRAYFALAAKFHPDRFFGKKLGPARAAIERIFHRTTDAYETLTTEATRADYDATLPPVPAGARTSRAPAAVKTPPPRKSSKMLRSSSRRMSAAKKLTPTPASKEKTAAEASPQRSPEKWRQLRAAAREVEIQARVEPLLRAAEEALKANDPIGAANNFRLALQHRDDPFVRLKLEDADHLAKAVRFERSVACARAAEDDRRWPDAAIHYGRAHDTKPTAEIADRAANAIRASNGDLERAATLAEQAVSMDPKNARYRVTLGEVCLAAKLLTRAATHAELALDLAPRDPRAKELAAAIAKAKKEQS
ncbi:MAG: DnaJ domain-containing protein [Labilithrix sp.]|nr:DnaJ domain-containing protein [Labilithrix sp.]